MEVKIFFLESFQTESIAITNLLIPETKTHGRHLYCSSSPFSGKCKIIQTISFSFEGGAHSVSVLQPVITENDGLKEEPMFPKSI